MNRADHGRPTPQATYQIRYTFEHCNLSGPVVVTQTVGWADALRIDELLEATPTLVRVQTTDVLLVRTKDQVLATEPLCPHKFADLSEGTVENGCLHCPMHDAAFCLPSGEARPGDEWAGRLDLMESRVVDGVVQVRVG